MNLTAMLHRPRQIIAAAAVVVITATSVLFVGTASADTESAKPVVTERKTKEWRTASSTADNVVLAAKDPQASLRKTKEW